MKKALIIISVLLLGIVAGFFLFSPNTQTEYSESDWDRMDFEPTYRNLEKIVIDEAFVVINNRSGKNIGNVTLLSPLELKIFPGRNREVFRFKLKKGQVPVKKILSRMDFYDLKNNDKHIERNIRFEYAKTIEEVNITDYKMVCDPIKKDSDDYELPNCSKIVDGSHIEYEYEWEEISLNKATLPKEEIIIRGVTDVYSNERVEWIPTFFGMDAEEGVRITEWATWSSNFDTGLISYWDLDQESGNMTDIFSNNDGIVRGSAIRGTTGISNKSIKFGSDGDIYVYENDSFDMNGNISISLWFNASDAEISSSLLTKEDYGVNRPTYTLQYFTGGAIRLFGYSGSTAEGLLVSSTTITDNEWHHIVAMINSTTWTLCIDGVCEFVEDNTALTNYDDGLTFGSRNNDTGSYLNASLDEIAMWNRALSLDEVSTLYDSGNGTFYEVNEFIVSLNSPENNTNFSVNSVIFNCSSFDEGGQNLNLSLFVDGELKNTVFNTTASQSNISLEYNVTGLSFGLHNWTCEGSSLTEFDVGTEIRIINVTAKASEISLNYPADNFLTSNPNISFNCNSSDDIGLIELKLYVDNILNSTLTNSTVNQTDLNLTYNGTYQEGTHNWYCFSKDNEGLITNSTTFIFEIDKTKPNITVETPTGNIPYGLAGTILDLNFTVNDTNLDSCWYNYNGTNISIACSSGVRVSTNFTLEEDNTNITIYANDSAGNLQIYINEWGYVFFEGFTLSNESINETQTQTISLNITSSENILQISAILVYNGTNFTGAANCVGSLCSITDTFDTPLVTSGESQNNTFYWILSLYNGTGVTTVTTSNQSQIANRIHLEKCNSTYNETAFNFTAYDERDLTKIDPFSFEGFFEFWLGNGNIKRNITFQNASISEFLVCIDRNMTVDAEIDYNDPANATYNERNYYYEDYDADNITENVSLYLLNKTFSTSFILEVEDQKNSEVPGALIYIQRWYNGLGEFKTVQISKTDDNGKTGGFYETETVDYRHIIIKDGVTELTTDKGKILPESTPFTLIFKIGDASLYPWNEFEKNPDIDTTFNFNKTTNITTFSWVDETGSVTEGGLLVYLVNNSGPDLLICNETLAFQSGTLTCNVTGYTGRFIAGGYISQSPAQFWESINFVISTARAIFGNTGIIIGFFIILTAGLAFIWNPTAMIVAINAATIFVNIIGFISFGPIFLFGMIGLSVIIIAYMKT